MTPKNSRRFAEITEKMVLDILRSRKSEEMKMVELGRVCALYGCYAQALGKIEELKERISELEDEK